MTDTCNPQHERNGDVSTSDDDSLSLLCVPNPCQSTGAAEDMEISDLDSQVGNKEQNKEMEMEVNQVKPTESGIPSCAQSAAGCSKSTTQLASNALPCVKIPNKTRLHKRNPVGETLLHQACKRNDVARVKALIQAGISVNVEDYAGWTALHEASAAGNEAVVEELLKAGANVNIRSCDGVTPLDDAVAAEHYQVVKLLLQYGSSTTDRSVSGFSAVDMAKDESIKELLLTFQASCVLHEQPYVAPGQCRQAGETSSVARCQSSFSPGHNDTANVQPGESGDRDGAREPGDIQLGKKDTTADNLNQSEAITAALEQVRGKQTEVSAWPLGGLEDADRHHAALTQIHNVLIDVLAKQRMEKKNFDQKYRGVSNHLRQRLLRSQLYSLASRQRTLVEILQKQMHSVEVYVSVMAKLSTKPPERLSGVVVGRQPDHFSPPASTSASSKASEAHSSNQASQTKERQRPVTPISVLKSAPPDDTVQFAAPRAPTPSLTQGKNPPAHTDVLNKKASRCQSRARQPGKSSQRVSFQRKGKNVLTQTRAEDNSRHLSNLIQMGLVPAGSTLQLLFKGQQHLAQVLRGGSLKDTKGKSHLTPERWLESVIGNNIPVSSAYAWDKVTFRGKPLSYYLLNMEAEGNTPPAHHKDDVQHQRAGSSQETLPTEPTNLDRLMRVRTIRLVEDEELMPNAVMDYYWEKLLKKDSLHTEDWGNDFL